MTAPPANEFSAWLIDLDGTLYRPLGVKIAMGIQLALRGRGALRTVRAFRAELERVRCDETKHGLDPFQHQLCRAAACTGIDAQMLEATVTEWMFHRPRPWLRLFRRRSLLAEIATFRLAGGRTGLVSDYPAMIKLQALNAAHLFDVVVASGEPGGPPRLKPAPDGFLLAAERLGAAPADCLVIGDRLDTDGEAARRAGMAFRKIS
jgi:HAD superfamily hydrolase (TIGR01549 family)